MSWAKKEITLTLMPSDFRHASRRGFLGLIGAGLAVGLAAPAWALDTDEAREKLAAVGCEPFKGTAASFGVLVRDELPKWVRIVKESGASID